MSKSHNRTTKNSNNLNLKVRCFCSRKKKKEILPYNGHSISKVRVNTKKCIERIRYKCHMCLNAHISSILWQKNRKIMSGNLGE